MQYRHTAAAVIGLTMIVFGISQIRKPETWEKYIPDTLDTVLPIDKDATMRLHGSGNILLGLALVIHTHPKLIRTTAGFWWIWVALFCGRFDWRIAVRDMLVGTVLLSMPNETKK